MNNTNALDPSVHTFLDGFFSDFHADADEEIRSRVALVRQDLLSHLDEEGWRILDPVRTVLLETEQQLGRRGAFARAARASDLFCALEHYLQPVHAQAGLEQRSTQLAVVAAIVERLWRDRIISTKTVSACCRIEFDIAMKQARSIVAEARVREQKLSR